MNIRNMGAFIALALCLCLVACSASQIVTDLDIAAAAVATIANVPSLSPSITGPLADAATALDCVAAAVQAGGTNAQVAVASASCGLTAFKPAIPPGTPQTVVALLQAVDDAIAKVIQDQAQISVAMNGSYEAGAFATAFGNNNAPQGGKTFNAGHGGKAKVTNIRKNLNDAKGKIPKKPVAPPNQKTTCPPVCN